MGYLLLDEGPYGRDDLDPLRNLVAALFRLGNSRVVDEARRVVEALIDWPKESEQEGLRGAFAMWLRQVFLPERVPGAEF